MVSIPPEPLSRHEQIVIVHAPEDEVWGLWLQQIGADAGLDLLSQRMSAAESSGEGSLLETAGGVLVLVISENFVRAVGESPGWDRLAGRGGVCALIIGAAKLPAAADDIPAIDMRKLPDEAQARSQVLRVLGRPDFEVVDQTLGEAPRARVRYPGQQLSAPYQSMTVPAHRTKWFFGREQQLEQIRMRLDTDGAAVLTGPAGSGKSWLATAFVHRFRTQYDLIAWIRGENGTVMRADLAELAQPLKLPDSVPRETKHLAVVNALRNSGLRYLIVYDDVTPDRYRSAGEHFPLRRKAARLAEVVPWDGPGHVLFTSKAEDWDMPRRISVPGFTAAEGGSFLRRHATTLSDDLAEQLSVAVAGSAVLMNALAHRGARGTEVIDQGFLSRLRAGPFSALQGEDPYKQASAIFGDSLRPLIESPEASDSWAAGRLLQLLTTFVPDQPIPLSLLTSQLAGGGSARAGRLPRALGEALGSGHRTRAVLNLITRDSIVEACPDPLAEHGLALRIHAVPWHGIRDFLSREVADENRHIAHRVLCDADPVRTEQPESWPRYLLLWQQLEVTDALRCARVADPDDPCSGLPTLIGNVTEALRVQGELTAAAGLGLYAAELWSDLLGPDDIRVVRLRVIAGNALWQLGRLSEAREVASGARAGVERQKDRYPEEFVRSSDLLAACLRMAGNWTAAVAVNEESCQWAREHMDGNYIETIRAAHNLAVAYRMVGRFEDALDYDTANLERFRSDPLLASFAAQMLHCINNIARDQRELGDYESSVVLQRQVLQDFMDLLHNSRHQHTLRGRKNLAVSLRKSGRYAHALELQRATFSDHVEVYGEEHPESVASRTNLANDYRVTDDLDQALTHAADAYRICRRVRPDHPYTGACAVNYAAVLRTLGRNQEALELDREGVRILTERLGADHPYTLAAQTDLASDLAGLGRVEDAVELGADTLDRLRRVRGERHPYTLQCAFNHSLDLRALGRGLMAEALERATLADYVATLGADHPEVRAAVAGVRGTCDIEPPPM